MQSSIRVGSLEDIHEESQLIYRRGILAVNALLWISGLVILISGVYVNVDMSDANTLVGPAIYVATNNLLYISGGIIMVFGLLGCFELFRTKRLLLCLFAYAVTLVFVLQCVVAAMSFTWQNEVHYIVDAELMKFIREGHTTNYTGSLKFAAMEKIQVRFECCGAHNYTDWTNSGWLIHEERMGAIPFSCCKAAVNAQDCTLDHLERIDTKGCIEPLTKRYQQNYVIMGSSSIGISILQFILFHISNYLMFYTE